MVMGNGRTSTEGEGTLVRRVVPRVIPGAAVAALLLAAVGCPLPYQFTPQGWSSSSGTVDPSTPSITAMPTFSYSSAGGSGTLQNGQMATTTADTQIVLQADTVGSVIYYTTDGSTPDPRASSTHKFSSESPITLAIASPDSSDSSVALTIKATAIGPNMKPSLVSSATVTVQYPQTAAPTFTPAPGFYLTNQTVTLSSTTAGSTLYYTIVNGSGPAPRPQPGQSGTTQYSGGIPVGPVGTMWTIAAIAVHDQMIDSATASATYNIDDLASYATLTAAGIAAASPLMASTDINNSDGNVFPVGQILLYVTSEGRYGKMVITNNNADGNHGIQFKFITYASSDGTVWATNDAATCRGTWSFDLDSQPAGAEGAGSLDFWMRNDTDTNRALQPQGGAKFFLGGVDPAP